MTFAAVVDIHVQTTASIYDEVSLKPPCF